MKMESSTWDEIADEYYDQIISPLSHHQYNPLFETLKKITHKKHKLVGDFGCGTGPLIETLAEKFKFVHALDYSKGMIKKAKENNLCHNNVNYHQQNLSKKFPKKLDCIFAINSIISPDLTEIEKTFSNISNTLKKQGVFIGVLPSLEAITEEFKKTYHFEYRKFKSHELAYASTKKKLQIQRLDPHLGVYDTDDMSQKYYTKYELEQYLKKNSLKLLEMDKVIYNKEFSYNYMDKNLKGHEPMWDWFVFAKKV